MGTGAGLVRELPTTHAQRDADRGPQARTSPKVDNPNIPDAARNAQEAARQLATLPSGPTVAQAQSALQRGNLLSLRADPEKMLEKPDSAPDPRLEAERELALIDTCFASSEVAEENRWHALSRLMSKTDLEEAKRLARRVHPERGAEIVVAFCETLANGQARRPQKWRARNAALAPDWYRRPFYAFDPRYFFAPESSALSSFEDAARGLDYVAKAGFRNVMLLDPYDTEFLAGGRGISEHAPSKVLGGDPGFARMMDAALRRELCLVPSLPVAHTGLTHPWFKRALAGDRRKQACYEDGTTIDPFRARLNLRNPDVLRALFRVIARDVNAGLLGLSPQAMAGLIKKPGLTGEGLPETHDLAALLKLFLRLLGDREVLIPNTGADAENGASYCGRPTQIRDVATSSEGDLFFWRAGSSALRNALLSESKGELEATLAEMQPLPPTAQPIVSLEGHGAAGRIADALHHDERRIALAHFCLYMMPAIPLIQAGSEIGATSNRAHAELMQKLRHRYLTSLGLDVDEADCMDPSALEGGVLPASSLLGSARAKKRSLGLVQAMNELWDGTLLGGEVEALETGSKSTLAWSKLTPAGNRTLLVANLGATPARVRIPRQVARRHLPGLGRANVRVIDLIETTRSGRNRPTVSRLSGQRYEVQLPAYGFALLNAVRIKQRRPDEAAPNPGARSRPGAPRSIRPR